MSDDIMTVLEFHEHPAGDWCDEARCYQRAEQERTYPGSTARAYAAPEPEILAFGERTDNAQLMKDCYTLGYLPDFVFDATFGKGRFWRSYMPPMLTTNDLNASSAAGYADDFRDMRRWANREFATVIFDPPYKLNGTSTGEGPSASDDDYGVGGPYSSVAEKMLLIKDGIEECARLADRYLIVKCQDQVVSGAVVWQTRIFADHAEAQGFRLKDMLHVRGYRRQPPGRRQLHARRDYSSALVFVRE